MEIVPVLMLDGKTWNFSKRDVEKIARPVKYFKELENNQDSRYPFAVMLDFNDFIWCTRYKPIDDKNVIVYFERPESRMEAFNYIKEYDIRIAEMLLHFSEQMGKLDEERKKRLENSNS